MTFANWLEDHLVCPMLVSTEKWDGRTVRLVEKGVMELKVEDVPHGAFVVRFDKGNEQVKKESDRLIKPNKELNINWRCDYVILEESSTIYTATFIELKRSLRDDDAQDDVDFKGEEQLLWSLPGLKHLLAIFETDAEREPHNLKIQVRYFIVAKCPSPWYRKRVSKTKFPSRLHRGIQVNYMVTHKTNMKHLKAREPAPVGRH